MVESHRLAEDCQVMRMAQIAHRVRDTIGGPERRTLNIERPTSNVEVNACNIFTSTLEVRSWTFDVRIFCVPEPPIVSRRAPLRMRVRIRVAAKRQGVEMRLNESRLTTNKCVKTVPSFSSGVAEATRPVRRPEDWRVPK